MFDLIKKTILIGAGLASLTREKVEGLANELVKRGELSEKEGRALVDDLIERSKKVRQELEKRVEKQVAKSLERLNIPTRGEIMKIWARIEDLERSKEDKKDSCS